MPEEIETPAEEQEKKTFTIDEVSRAVNQTAMMERLRNVEALDYQRGKQAGDPDIWMKAREERFHILFGAPPEPEKKKA